MDFPSAFKSRVTDMKSRGHLFLGLVGSLACAMYANAAVASDRESPGNHSPHRHHPPGEVIPVDIYDPLGLVSRDWHGQLISLADGFSFTEGPAADRHGNVFFTDQPNDKI